MRPLPTLPLNPVSDMLSASAKAAVCDGESADVHPPVLPEGCDSTAVPSEPEGLSWHLWQADQRSAEQQDSDPLAELSLCLACTAEAHRRHRWPDAIDAASDEEPSRIAFTPTACCDFGLRYANPIRLAGVLHDMTSAIDRKDPYTCGHSDRVARLAVQLAKELGWRLDQLVVVHLAGLLHDIGKIGVQAEILRKPASLTPEEYEQVKSHPRLGHEILLDVDPLRQVLPAVLHHHEHWDGSGYPSGLAGDEIPDIARIVAVADAYDAMTSERPYRGSLPRSEVRRIFLEGLGRHWDPQVLNAFLKAEPCFHCSPLMALPASADTIR